MKRAALGLFFLILTLFARQDLAQASLKLYVAQREVALSQPLVMINGNIMIPLETLEEYLGAQANWHKTSGEITLVFPDQTILMQLGQESAQSNGRTFQLDVAPQQVEDTVTVPLRFIADRRRLNLVFVPELMGLRLEGPALQAPQPEEVEPAWEKAPPLPQREPQSDLREIIFMGGPRSRVFIDLASYTGYQTNLLVNPDRLVIDLFGVSGEGLPTLEVNDFIVQRIRTSRFDEQTLRIVCDLNNSTGYRISPWPEGGLEIEFNYQLFAVDFERAAEAGQLSLEISAQPPIEVVYLDDPLRLVLDLQNTTLIGTAFDLPLEHERVRRLRVSQYMPSIARIVLELNEPMAPLPVGEEGSRYLLPLFPGTAREAQIFLAEMLAAQPLSFPEDSGSWPEEGDSLLGYTVVVDPGHGGSDPGTIGHQGTFEKDVALAIGKFLGDLLQKAGARVVYTREQDLYVSVFERPEIALAAEADIFVSIHANSHVERGIARGTETLYRANDQVSQCLARHIQDELVQAVTLIDRRIWPRRDLAVFNGSDIPAVLVEVGFLDHPEEEILLTATGFQKVAAEGIFKGIERFFRGE